MIVLIAIGAVVFAGLVGLGVLGYDLVGHLLRLRRALETARADVEPRLARLQPPAEASTSGAARGLKAASARRPGRTMRRRA